MPPAPRGQGKPQRDRPREGAQNPSNRSSAPATGSAPRAQSRSGTSTPDIPPASTTTVASSIIPSEVREYMHQRWQKLYDEAMTQDKSQSPSTTIFIPQPAAAGQQGWSTVGGKSAQKATPWGTQPNRNLTSRGVTFQAALKTALDEQKTPAKGG